MGIKIRQAISEDSHILAVMVGELLHEIMREIGEQAFHFDLDATEKRAGEFIEKRKYSVFLAKDSESGADIGFISLYESHALYAEGSYGTIPELYVRPAFRSQGAGEMLLCKAREFGKSQGWKRLEVTTPPLPEFNRTLQFYKRNGLSITGGRKLKVLL